MRDPLGEASDPSPWPRRRVLKFLAASGIGTATFGRAPAAVAAEQAVVTSEMIDHAEWISGIDMTPEERTLMLDGIQELLQQFDGNRAVALDNGVPPAIRFDPGGSRADEGFRDGAVVRLEGVSRPDSEEDLAFLGVERLGAVLRAGEVSAAELAETSLRRMERFDPVLRCVITPTPELARAQASAAQARLEAGAADDLVGIPWGAKDLLSVPGYPTTWGARPYRDQVLDVEATAVSRLRQAGAVLTAKTSLGALAWGDVWFGGMTRNPWNPAHGSSGSSAGSASAVAAGVVPFAIGSETWGSIVSPCTRCGVTGLRPTFGRVSRHGAMALSWSMDKLGPIARSARDCRIVFRHLAGVDAADPSTVDRPFDERRRGGGLAGVRIGFVADAFEADRSEGAGEDAAIADLAEWAELDRAVLAVLEASGATLVPIRLPSTIDVSNLSLILTAEASAAFDDLTRSGRDDDLTRQIANAWPNVLRQGQLIPAVEYLRANRLRTLVQREWNAIFDRVDVYVTPSFVGDGLLATNLTGHPQVVVPDGFLSSKGTPVSISLVGRLFGEDDLLAVAEAFQSMTDHHLRRPDLDAVLAYREDAS